MHCRLKLYWELWFKTNSTVCVWLCTVSWNSTPCGVKDGLRRWEWKVAWRIRSATTRKSPTMLDAKKGFICLSEFHFFLRSLSSFILFLLSWHVLLHKSYSDSLRIQPPLIFSIFLMIVLGLPETSICK